jgi:hypothetical protein
MRLAAGLVGLMGLILVGSGVYSFVEALFLTQSMQFGLIVGPILVLAGLPGVIAFGLLWREGRGWRLAVGWSAAMLLVAIWSILSVILSPATHGPPPVSVVWAIASAVALVTLLIARTR